MAAVTLFTVVVKDGGFRKLAEVLLIIVIGAGISNIICFSLWPSSATTRLQTSIGKTLESFATLLNLLGATFLLDRPDASYQTLSVAVKAHDDAFTKLKADLAEAQHEKLVDGRMDSRQQERYSPGPQFATIGAAFDGLKRSNWASIGIVACQPGRAHCAA